LKFSKIVNIKEKAHILIFFNKKNEKDSDNF
jgi:hypothetical protein